MSSLALSGLASGVDTSAIVDQLMALERQSLTKLQLRQSKLTTRDSGLREVQSRLTNLKDAARALQSSELWGAKQTTESSAPTQVGVERISGAGTGGSAIRVLNLASSTQRTYGFAVNPATRSYTFTSGGTTSSLAIGANATLDEVVAGINGRSDLPVFAAAVVPTGGGPAQLVLSSRTSGTASDFSLDEVDAMSVSTPQASVALKAGRNAEYLVDGLGDPANGGAAFSAPTNLVENAIPGLRLTFKAVTATDVSINVGSPALDKEAIKTKVRAFTEAYNAMISTVSSKLSEKTNPTATSTSSATKGQLFGDSQLSSMLSSFRITVSQDFGDVTDVLRNLQAIGISTGAAGTGSKGSDAVAGKLTVDETKLSGLLETDAAGVRKLLDGPLGVVKGIEAKVAEHVGSAGVIDARLKYSVEEQKRLTDTMASTEIRLAAKEKRMRAQFAAMESALQASQTQQAWLSAQLGSMNNQQPRR